MTHIYNYSVLRFIQKQSPEVSYKKSVVYLRHTFQKKTSGGVLVPSCVKLLNNRKSCHWYESLLNIFIEYKARGMSVKLEGLVIYCLCKCIPIPESFHRIMKKAQNSINLAFSCSVHLFSGFHFLQEINHSVLCVSNV